MCLITQGSKFQNQPVMILTNYVTGFITDSKHTQKKIKKLMVIFLLKQELPISQYF